MLRPIIIPIVPRQRPLCPFVQARTGRSSKVILRMIVQRKPDVIYRRFKTIFFRTLEQITSPIYGFIYW
jgi:hypothetical protein